MTRNRKGLIAAFAGFAIGSCEPSLGVGIALTVVCAVVIALIPLEG